MNDFGIFVDPQVISHPRLDSAERPSRDAPEFGGVYIGLGKPNPIILNHRDKITVDRLICESLKALK